MIQGPDIVIECPHCKTLLAVSSITSGNTFGSKLWSDGRQDSPMMPRNPRLTKCHNCSGFFWVGDAKVIGEIDLEDRYHNRAALNPIWVSAPYVCEMTELEYYEAIKAGLAANQEREIELRIHAWWCENDADRSEKERSQQTEIFNPKKTENLTRLFEIIEDQSGMWQLVKSDVARQLGRFDEAIDLLNAIRDPELKWATTQMIEFSKSRNRKVRELRR